MCSITRHRHGDGTFPPLPQLVVVGASVVGVRDGERATARLLQNIGSLTSAPIVNASRHLIEGTDRAIPEPDTIPHFLRRSAPLVGCVDQGPCTTEYIGDFTLDVYAVERHVVLQSLK